MSFYIVRVELHEATAADYHALHQQMELNGFERVISDDSGRVFELPNGEYGTGLDLSIAKIRDLVVRSAAVTGKQSKVLVTEMTRWAWHGLKQVQLTTR